MSSRLPHVPSRQHLQHAVWTVLGMNPGPYELTGTNTYLVGTGKKRVLIDTGDGRPEYLKNLLETMKLAGAEGLQEIIITHWHPDHLGGVPALRDHFGHDVPIRKLMPDVEDELQPEGEASVDPYSFLPRHEFTRLHDNDEFRIDESIVLRVMHTPGHAKDHVVLLLEGTEEKAIFTGDNVLGFGSSVFFLIWPHTWRHLRR